MKSESYKKREKTLEAKYGSKEQYYQARKEWSRKGGKRTIELGGGLGSLPEERRKEISTMGIKKRKEYADAGKKALKKSFDNL